MKRILFMTLPVIVTFTLYSQSRMKDAYDLLNTKRTFEIIAKETFKGVLADSGTDDRGNHYQAYQIPPNDSMNVRIFCFTSNQDKQVVEMLFMPRIGVYYERGLEEMGYAYYGDPTYYRFQTDYSKMHFEFYHEKTDYFNRHHLLLVAEDVPDYLNNTIQDRIILYGWTNLSVEDFIDSCIEQ